jgi:hypothetical protein
MITDTDHEFDIRETHAAQDLAFAKVWSDSELDEYNDYDAHQPLDRSPQSTDHG